MKYFNFVFNLFQGRNKISFSPLLVKNISFKKTGDLPKGARVAFQRMLKGPKRYFALFDTYYWSCNVDSALRITIKAMNQGIYLNRERSELLIEMLVHNMRVREIETLLSNDKFQVTKKIILDIIKPLIVSGKTEYLSLLMKKFARSSNNNIGRYQSLQSEISNAKARRLWSSTPITLNESIGFEEIENIFDEIYLNSKIPDPEFEDNIIDDHINPLEFHIEDRAQSIAPNLFMNDLTKQLERHCDGYFVLYNSKVWRNFSIYSTRDDDIANILKDNFRISEVGRKRREFNNLGSLSSSRQGSFEVNKNYESEEGSELSEDFDANNLDYEYQDEDEYDENREYNNDGLDDYDEEEFDEEFDEDQYDSEVDNFQSNPIKISVKNHDELQELLERELSNSEFQIDDESSFENDFVDSDYNYTGKGTPFYFYNRYLHSIIIMRLYFLYLL